MGLDKKVGYVRSVRSSENDSYCCKTNNLWWDFILSNFEYEFNLLRNEKTYDIIWCMWLAFINVFLAWNLLFGGYIGWNSFIKWILLWYIGSDFKLE